ncbi:BlaI/MecI/CopY family transcriptional regulator [Faecalicoccus pleomorphus]|uniref:BlaI/MecI/CopY family transcriptional regulator n=1 Tax=Faecalicoccus pleomorphus TaxID=1323 RepID=UPI00232F3786|nr:BlaI/MecI/CopY family transcriptional regulator [Faecalicoccus pleomorphus]MDB7987068.1 BlaI/MecI/CopY family transcriptional regulator [Faecalicoccus pleomorphus]MDB7992106.1 BlaI/MecI/CopY family transcriptional regulator [Faecalicoccus pleomorphus]
MKIKLLTKRQNEVMSVLWNSESPLSANQICDKDEDLNMNTVQQVLRTLLKIQFIKIEDIGYSNTVLTRLYSPVVKQTEYLQFLLGNTSTFDLTSSLIDHNKNLDELKQLQVLIEKKCKELEE